MKRNFEKEIKILKEMVVKGVSRGLITETIDLFESYFMLGKDIVPKDIVKDDELKKEVSLLPFTNPLSLNEIDNINEDDIRLSSNSSFDHDVYQKYIKRDLDYINSCEDRFPSLIYDLNNDGYIYHVTGGNNHVKLNFSSSTLRNLNDFIYKIMDVKQLYEITGKKFPFHNKFKFYSKCSVLKGKVELFRNKYRLHLTVSDKHNVEAEENETVVVLKEIYTNTVNRVFIGMDIIGENQSLIEMIDKYKYLSKDFSFYPDKKYLEVSFVEKIDCINYMSTGYLCFYKNPLNKNENIFYRLQIFNSGVPEKVTRDPRVYRKLGKLNTLDLNSLIEKKEVDVYINKKFLIIKRKGMDVLNPYLKSFLLNKDIEKVDTGNLTSHKLRIGKGQLDESNIEIYNKFYNERYKGSLSFSISLKTEYYVEDQVWLINIKDISYKSKQK